MILSELLAAEKIDLSDKEKVALLQKFYQVGYCQGLHDKTPDYDYSIKYREVVERVLELFNKTNNPINLKALERCLDELDKYRKGHGI